MAEHLKGAMKYLKDIFKYLKDVYHMPRYLKGLNQAVYMAWPLAPPTARKPALQASP